MDAGGGVPNGGAIEVHVGHIAPRRLHRLLDRDGHFPRLTATKAHTASAITDHGERRKTEDAATLDHLGYAIDLDELLNQTFFFDFFRIGHDASLRTADRLHAPHLLAL